MSEENDYLLKYFFLMGVPENITSTLKLSPLDRNNTITPSLLSSYSAEGMTDLFKLIQKELNNDHNDQYLRDNIFPKKSNFLSDIEFPEDINEPPNPFNDYLYEAENFDQIRPHFVHCFQYNFQLNEKIENSIFLNFAVLIFYENVTNEDELLEEKKNSWVAWVAFFWKSKYHHIYVAKALILVSDKPVFSLMKEILENIYQKIDKKFTYFPLEKIIINCFDIINSDDIEQKKIIQKKFKLEKEPILPYCDLNISFFFNLFNSKDLFLLAEYYLCSKNIIIASTNISYLFPIYHILMTLFFPLNKNTESTFYKLVVPNEAILQRTLFSSVVPTFEFIYIENKLEDQFLEKICKIKNDILVYQIVENKKSIKENKIGIYKKIFKSEEKEGQEAINKLNIDNYKTIIEKICKLNGDLYEYLIPLIRNDLEDIKKDFDKKNPSFFRNSIEKKYESLRNHLIGLFIKFFVMRLNPIKCIKNDDNEFKIELITFKEFENDDSANELLSSLYTTPQSDLVYKNNIISSGQFDNSTIKNIILLDYFIKISHTDDKRAYFEPKVLKNLKAIEEMNKEEDNNKKNKTNKKAKKDNNIDKNENNDKKSNNFDVVELLDYKTIINEERNYFYYINRLYLYLLQNPDKARFKINKAGYFIKHLEYYQKLTKMDRKKDIDLIHDFIPLKYIIFFGEKFELHFGQFINKNIPILELNYQFQKPDTSAIDYIDNNKNYEQYYKATLDEAEIFYDLFITQIIPIENKEELAACAIALYVLIYVINLLSELNSKNPHNKKIIEIVNKKLIKVYRLFNKTKFFYGKYDFLITLLYIVISSRDNQKEGKKNFTELFMKSLSKDEKMLPIIILLMNNHKISLDFRVIKEFIEKNNRIKKNIKNQSIILSENQKSFYVNYEPIKEYNIYNIERKQHQHEYELKSGINDDYFCKEKCGEILGFKIQIKKDDNPVYDFVNNPRYMIIKLLKKIVDNKSLFVFSFNNYNDIFQIVMLDELYFKIGFFRTEKSNNQ